MVRTACLCMPLENLLTKGETSIKLGSIGGCIVPCNEVRASSLSCVSGYTRVSDIDETKPQTLTMSNLVSVCGSSGTFVRTNKVTMRYRPRQVGINRQNSGETKKNPSNPRMSFQKGFFSKLNKIVFKCTDPASRFCINTMRNIRSDPTDTSTNYCGWRSPAW